MSHIAEFGHHGAMRGLDGGGLLRGQHLPPVAHFAAAEKRGGRLGLPLTEAVLPFLALQCAEIGMAYGAIQLFRCCGKPQEGGNAAED